MTLGGMSGDEISLLKDEFMQHSVKSSLVVPKENPLLICSVWTKNLTIQTVFVHRSEAYGRRRGSSRLKSLVKICF